MSQCCSPPTIPGKAEKTLLIELLYLDRDVCTRCRGAEDALDLALVDAFPALHAMGYEIDLRRILVDKPETAQQLRFRSSPTIRVNGQDIQSEIRESSCESCGSLVGAGPVDCREWTWRGEHYTSPPKGMIVEALMRAAAAPQETIPEKEYLLPDNLRRFFQGRDAVTASCGCNTP